MDPREWRKSEELTISELAVKLHRSEGYVSLIENGRRKPSFDIIQSYMLLSKGKVTFRDFSAGKSKPRRPELSSEIKGNSPHLKA